MLAVATMNDFSHPALSGGSSAGFMPATDSPQLLQAMREISQVLAVYDEQSYELLLDCKPSRRDGEWVYNGEKIIENCRPFLRPTNFVVACRPDKNYQWRFFYVNQVSGAVLDPTTYLKLSMDSPHSLPLPIMSTQSLELMAGAKAPIDLPLYEVDFILLERLSRSWSRAIRFALRHRLQRYLRSI